MSQDTLVLTHVIFRHGNRTPELIYPHDPHKGETFFPTGRGHLTIEGKRAAYALGQNLRKKYDKLLGKVYVPNIVDAWTTDSDRTKMTLQIVLAALFPPTEEQRFEEALNWQPIPYKYKEISDDDMLLSVVHSNTIEAYDEYLQSSEGIAKLKQHQETFESLSRHTGSTIKSPKDTSILYTILKVEEEAGLSLPTWTTNYWPKLLEALAINHFHFLIATSKLRKLVMGELVTKIIMDTHRKFQGVSASRMHIYSGHDVNIGALLSYFEIPFESYPTYCSYITFEIHKIDENYGIKILYQDCSQPEPKVTKFKNGEEYLHFDEFKRNCEDICSEELVLS